MCVIKLLAYVFAYFNFNFGFTSRTGKGTSGQDQGESHMVSWTGFKATTGATEGQRWRSGNTLLQPLRLAVQTPDLMWKS